MIGRGSRTGPVGLPTSVTAAAALVVLLAVTAPPARSEGVAMAGRDEARIQLPVSALAKSYENAGYRVTVAEGVASVAVDLVPIASGSPFEGPPPGNASGAVERVARAVSAGATTDYEAASRILDWVARNVRYELDRSLDQAPEAVLRRRSAYCTGVARIAVALLEAVSIEAREVPGFVVASPTPEIGAGFHRWVEIRFPDVGWVFSDPLATHHYVPATYVPLASESLLPDPGSDRGTLLERRDGRHAVDLFPTAPPGVTARRNSERQISGALRVTVPGAETGVAVLEGLGTRRTRALVEGMGTFLGLEPGTYLLRVFLEGREPMEKRIVFRDRVRGAVILPLPS